MCVCVGAHACARACARGSVVKNNIGRHASKTVCQNSFPGGQMEVQEKGREIDGEIKREAPECGEGGKE